MTHPVKDDPADSLPLADSAELAALVAQLDPAGGALLMSPERVQLLQRLLGTTPAAGWAFTPCRSGFCCRL